ncbi:flagellar basal body protein [Hydrogenophaga sp. PAMC20947]|uniref:flagellar basal body protein n=1 Tax=Hydrogenophaga sp. PAMC20947 TaxID=2565558 RepID=UPI00109E1C59|nr:flagellar basal body protein [Hydrogenophaga sp. PAMC20947]QCB44627.1 flagellar basal body rod protein [Hydrogenophaga sp. PAMC20947]
MSLSIPSGTSATATAISGMRAAQRNLDTSAHNVANLQTPGFKRQTAEQMAQPGLGGVSTALRQAPDASGDGFAHLADDLVEQRMSLYSFAANLKTVETEDQMLGTLLDTRA